jgi:hypothetical protein
MSFAQADAFIYWVFTQAIGLTRDVVKRHNLLSAGQQLCCLTVPAVLSCGANAAEWALSAAMVVALHMLRRHL